MPASTAPHRGAGDKLITCIVPAGQGHGLLGRLKTERGIIRCILKSARGIGITTLREIRQRGPLSEKDVLQLVAPGEQADELFQWLYFEAGIDQPHGGFMYQQPLGAATVMALPDVPHEE